MKNSDQPISPCIMQKVGDNSYRLSKGDGDPKEWRVPMSGLNKREYFAAKAMQGLLSNPGQIDTTNFEWVAQNAVGYADAILEELDKPTTSHP